LEAPSFSRNGAIQLMCAEHALSEFITSQRWKFLWDLLTSSRYTPHQRKPPNNTELIGLSH
jgi:hypothetical protein